MKPKSYSVTIKAVVVVAAESRKQAANVALGAVAESHHLLMVESINDGYESLADLDEPPPERPVRPAPRDPSSDIPF